MGLPNVGEITLVFLVVSSRCMCLGCLVSIRKHLKQIHRKLSIKYNKNEQKLTIKGSNVDSNLVIIELEKIKINVELVIDNNPALHQIEAEGHEIEVLDEEVSVEVDTPTVIEEETIVLETEFIKDEISAVVVSIQPSHNQASAPMTLSPATHCFCNIGHELELKDYAKKFVCDGCMEEGFNKRYRCKHCPYELHEDCKDPKPTASHDIFEGSIFKFSPGKPTCSSNLCRNQHNMNCEACKNEINGYSYHCEDKGVHLHPRCVNLPGNLCIEGDPWVLKTKATSECFWCNESENRTTSGWSYVSKGDKAQLHVKCVDKMAYETWKKKAIGGGDDAYVLVLRKLFQSGLDKYKKKSPWSRSRKLLKMIIIFARTIIGILLGDPTVILASMLVEIFKK